jgi:hypothetical protein
MKKKQDVHVGMVNSFNVLTGRITVEKIASLGIPVFAHNPNKTVQKENVEFMIFYFKDLEMYERCKELSDYIEKTYNSDGSFKASFCDCNQPEIDYLDNPKCTICNLEIMK